MLVSFTIWFFIASFRGTFGGEWIECKKSNMEPAVTTSVKGASDTDRIMGNTYRIEHMIQLS